MGPLTRRRFLAISAAAVCFPGAAMASSPHYRWRGSALGAEATITFTGLEETDAVRLAQMAEAEISRLEAIFSLYRHESALSRLNREGRLEAPPPELLGLLTLADGIHRATGGAFDPTVQPLWRLYATTQRPTAKQVESVRSRIGWSKLGFDNRAIAFSQSGMALTLNGIAQGAIAQRLADMLRDRGLNDVLIDAGEVVALGHRPDGVSWQAGVSLPDGEIVHRVALADRALATTAPLGTLLDRAVGLGHIIDPRNGEARAAWRLVSIAADNAAVADGLSTGAALLSRGEIGQALAAYPDAALETLV